jgi:hypothetical protein
MNMATLNTVERASAIQNRVATEKLKEKMQILDELRTKRSELQYDHALEIGALDKEINLAWAEASSLASLL